ncbi:AfsR/SARP family transcriptional regulator [Calidithermus chliarophilus]|uniref:AfsR/SARP family transcriptional regulator n=1 Tax=Calidithermus chliarophilus TaxID=52023 RepID=UPI0004223ADD|nr:tetratricopeptide repeat protein [Calidithermus chliarophilus]
MATYVQLLGTPAIRFGEEWFVPPPGRISALLYYLAYQRGWVGRDELAHLFWPDVYEENARTNLRKILNRARELSYAQDLEAERTRLRWPVDTDVEELKQALENRNFPSINRLYRGKFLQGFNLDDALEFEDWLELTREQLHKGWRKAVLNHATELEGMQRYAEGAEALELLLSTDPLDEEALQRQLSLLLWAGQLTRALGAFEAFKGRLEQELEVEPGPITLKLVEQIRRAEPVVERPVVPVPGITVKEPPKVARRHNLPVQATPFVGREAEKARITEQLADPACRLLTVVAQGGFGKTRLALSAAEAQLGAFEDGVWFVSFAATPSPDFMLYTLADALSLEFVRQQEPREQLLRYLADKEMLLVLDNLEHLTAGITLLSELLEAAPRLKILATSRERLNLRFEWLLELRGLDFPTRSGEDPQAFDAVQLFAQSARRSLPGFSLDESTLPLVARVCQVVEGMPLAIELAASWLRVLTLQNIVDELGAVLDLLESPLRDAPVRHRSIRAVFETSWKLLSPQERSVMQMLAIFNGSFWRGAAAEITGAPLSVLAALVDKSFLQLTPQGRYRWHPLVYQYSRERLQEVPELLAQVQQKHTSYYARLVEEWYGELYRGRQRKLLEVIQEELENIRTAWQWMFAENRMNEFMRTAGLLERYYQQRSRYQEGIEVLHQGARSLNPGNPNHRAALGGVYVRQAWLYYWLGKLPEGTEVGQRAVDLLRPLGPSAELMEGLNVLGAFAAMSGDNTRAEAYFVESLELARGKQDSVHMGYALNNLAVLARNREDYPQAERFFREALSFAREAQDYVGITRYLGALGSILSATGDFNQAEALLSEGLGIAREKGLLMLLPYLLEHMGKVAFQKREYPRAQTLWQEALSLARESGARLHEAEFLYHLGTAALALYQDAQALSHFRASLEISWSVRYDTQVISNLVGLAQLWSRTGQPERAVPLLRAVLGNPATQPSAREEAQRLLESLDIQAISPHETWVSDPPLENVVRAILTA